MSNKTNKPMLSSAQIVQMMHDDKGITFNYISEKAAADYLSDVNNYMRTASYRKNYTKVQGGKNDGKYENLDFAYLKELSTLDMYFRFIVSKMCLDIEHALKVKIIHDVEMDPTTDGYDIVYKFFQSNPSALNNLAVKITSPFTGDLIRKYFSIKTSTDPHTGRPVYDISGYDDCPVWVVVELFSYGEFIRFYNYYYRKNVPVSNNLLQLVRSLRNATAHNNCILANLSRNTSKPPKEIKIAVQKIQPPISKSQRQKNLTTRPMLEFVTLLYVYNSVVTEKVKYHHVKELRELFFGRMLEKKDFFSKNELINSNYHFACIMINSLIQ